MTYSDCISHDWKNLCVCWNHEKIKFDKSFKRNKPDEPTLGAGFEPETRIQQNKHFDNKSIYSTLIISKID